MLEGAGHEVVCFTRGPVGADAGGREVTGPVARMHENPHLAGRFDAVVNYIVLKDEQPEANAAFMDALVAFCAGRGVGHVVHISSVSSYKGSLTVVDEDAAVEADPQKKGAYGALKVASDNRLLERLPATIKLTMVRPGFVLGPGLMDPIIGSAARLPWNKLLLIGAGGTQFPMVSRAQLNRAVLTVLARPPAGARESLLLVSPDSPTKRRFLDVVAKDLGGGTGATVLPTWLWWAIATGAEAAAWVLGQRKLKPFSKLASRLRSQRFDSTRTRQRLGDDLRLDWPRELRAALDHQEPNFAPPYDPAARPALAARRVAFLGYGRIVLQKHVPALAKLGFAGDVDACDLHAFTAADGRHVKPLDACDLAAADLVVVASPGPAHAAAIDRLRGTRANVLVEKPLCYSAPELAAWRSFAAAHPGRVLVCHNYRYKQNVLDMLRFLADRNPGALHHVHLDFSSPPATNDSAAWLRDERRARTLLLDYSLHFVDIACMFARPGAPAWEVAHCRHAANARGQTSVIEGAVRSDYSVSFVLRQGFAPRRTRLTFTFQNYSVSLGFFPETFVPHMSNDSPWLYKQEQRARARATRQKVLDKALNRDSDNSHAAVLAAAGAAPAPADSAGDGLSVERLSPFYDLLFRLADRVYGDAPLPAASAVAAPGPDTAVTPAAAAAPPPATSAAGDVPTPALLDQAPSTT